MRSILMVGVVAMATLASCDGAREHCTQIGCVDGLEIRFGAQGLAEPGLWTLVLDVDGSTITCEVAVPFEPGDGPSCDDDRVFLTVSGTAGPASGHRVTEIAFHEDAPSQVDLVVALDGEVRTEVTLTPSYQTLQPNGPDCEPTCYFAAETVEVPQS